MKHIIEHQGKNIFKGITLLEDFEEPIWLQRHRMIVDMATQGQKLKDIIKASGYCKIYVRSLLIRYGFKKLIK